MHGLPELAWLERLARKNETLLSSVVLTEIRVREQTFPVTALRIGTEDPRAPTLGLIGGVHGLERIGTQVVLAYLESVLERLRWDNDLRSQFAAARIVAIPLVNPGGMQLRWRSNPNGVDLMRNAPVEADTKVATLVGGHRLSRWLPWFRGNKDHLELESAALCRLVEDEMFQAQTLLTLDCHSGFGTQDQLWYPYARQVGNFPASGEALTISSRFREAYPYHTYRVEPQAANYTTHGDLWDHLFDRHQELVGKRNYVPWTLEMGSWLWVRKNPAQLTTRLGPFNPTLPHRQHRTLRRHKTLFDFFWAMVRNGEAWQASDFEAADLGSRADLCGAVGSEADQ